MVRDEELAMTLLAEANPVPDEEELEFEPIATRYLESLRARRSLMARTKDPVDTSPDRSRRSLWIWLAAAAVVAAAIAIGSLVGNDPTPGPVD